MKQYIRADIEIFHDCGILIPNRTIYFGSEIEDEGEEGGVDFASSKKVIKNLLYLDNKGDEPITLYWNSPGGCVFRGMAIYDVIKGLRSKVIMIGLGMVRSMGTIIMQACDERILSPNTDFMIHDGTSVNYGETKTVIAWGKWDEKELDRMYSIYLEKIQVKHPKYTKKQISDLCTHDCIMSGAKALELGLVDKVL